MKYYQHVLIIILLILIIKKKHTKWTDLMLFSNVPHDETDS